MTKLFTPNFRVQARLNKCTITQTTLAAVAAICAVLILLAIFSPFPAMGVFWLFWMNVSAVKKIELNSKNKLLIFFLNLPVALPVTVIHSLYILIANQIFKPNKIPNPNNLQDFFMNDKFTDFDKFREYK